MSLSKRDEELWGEGMVLTSSVGEGFEVGEEVCTKGQNV